MNNAEFKRLLHEIATSSTSKIDAAELGCLTELVHFSGIMLDEVPGLQVSDVIDQNGLVNQEIMVKAGRSPIVLQDRARQAIGSYIDVLRARKSPPTPLFPSYETARTLRRHWKEFGTSYREIRESGIRDHFSSQQNSMPKGQIYKTGARIFRITDRQYRAVVEDKKIRSGTEINDHKRIEDLMRLLEESESISRATRSPASQNRATQILDEAREALSRIKTEQTRQTHSSIIDAIREQLEDR